MLFLPERQAGDTNVSTCQTRDRLRLAAKQHCPEQHVPLGRCDSCLAMLAGGAPHREQGTPCRCAEQVPQCGPTASGAPAQAASLRPEQQGVHDTGGHPRQQAACAVLAPGRAAPRSLGGCGLGGPVLGGLVRLVGRGRGRRRRARVHPARLHDLLHPPVVLAPERMQPPERSPLPAARGEAAAPVPQGTATPPGKRKCT